MFKVGEKVTVASSGITGKVIGHFSFYDDSVKSARNEIVTYVMVELDTLQVIELQDMYVHTLPFLPSELVSCESFQDPIKNSLSKLSEVKGKALDQVADVLSSEQAHAVLDILAGLLKKK
jgi:hypothetical protein